MIKFFKENCMVIVILTIIVGAIAVTTSTLQIPAKGLSATTANNIVKYQDDPNTTYICTLPIQFKKTDSYWQILRIKTNGIQTAYSYANNDPSFCYLPALRATYNYFE